jgi:hypothetical protein
VEQSTRIDVEAPVEQVWEVLREVERWPEWAPTVTSVRRLDDGPLAVGSRVRVEQPRIPLTEYVVTEREPNRSLPSSGERTQRPSEGYTPLCDAVGGCGKRRREPLRRQMRRSRGPTWRPRRGFGPRANTPGGSLDHFGNRASSLYRFRRQAARDKSTLFEYCSWLPSGGVGHIGTGPRSSTR